jgi:hypothetical protein
MTSWHKIFDHLWVLDERAIESLMLLSSFDVHLLINLSREGRHEWLEHRGEELHGLNSNVHNLRASLWVGFSKFPRLTLLHVGVAKR